MTKKNAAQPEHGIESYIKGDMSNIHQKVLQPDEGERLKLKQETAHYIHRMTADLCVMAAKADMEFLAYLIDMARIESYDRAHDQKLDKKLSVG